MDLSSAERGGSVPSWAHRATQPLVSMSRMPSLELASIRRDVGRDVEAISAAADAIMALAARCGDARAERRLWELSALTMTRARNTSARVRLAYTRNAVVATLANKKEQNVFSRADKLPQSRCLLYSTHVQYVCRYAFGGAHESSSEHADLIRISDDFRRALRRFQEAAEAAAPGTDTHACTHTIFPTYRIPFPLVSHRPVFPSKTPTHPSNSPLGAIKAAGDGGAHAVDGAGQLEPLRAVSVACVGGAEASGAEASGAQTGGAGAAGPSSAEGTDSEDQTQQAQAQEQIAVDANEDIIAAREIGIARIHKAVRDRENVPYSRLSASKIPPYRSPTCPADPPPPPISSLP